MSESGRRTTAAAGALVLCCLLIAASFPSPAAAAGALPGHGLGFGLARLERILVDLFERLGAAFTPIDRQEGATLVNGGAPEA